jgi:hypothetical protein
MFSTSTALILEQVETYVFLQIHLASIVQFL